MTPGIVLDEEMRAVLSHLAEGDEDEEPQPVVPLTFLDEATTPSATLSETARFGAAMQQALERGAAEEPVLHREPSPGPAIHRDVDAMVADNLARAATDPAGVAAEIGEHLRAHPIRGEGAAR